MRRTSITRDTVRRDGASGIASVTGGTGVVITGTPTNPVVGIAGGAGGTDIEYFKVSTSIAGQTTAPNWDRYRLWGQLGSGQSNSGIAIDDDILFDIPQQFNRNGIITDLTTWGFVGAGTVRVVFGLYGNDADGEVFPGSLLAQSAEFTPPANFSILKWSPNLPVTAGTLLHFVYAQKRGAPVDQYFTATALAATVGNGLFGSNGIGNSPGFPGPGFAEFALQQSGLTLVRPYNSVLPAIFPQVGTFALCPTGTTTQNMPSIAYRFVKT